MIIRKDGEGWLAITQPAHAWVSGKFAAAWGGERFPVPGPREALILAARLHDIGWFGWDSAPRLDADGLPINFLGASLEDTIPMWREAVSHVALMNPYSGLLVSMHATTIYRGRLKRGTDPADKQAHIQEMLDERAELQQVFRQRLVDHPRYGSFVDQTSTKRMYRLLRVCDLLSLLLCSDVFPPSGEFPDVPGPDPQETQTIQYEVVAPFHLHVTPYPFGDRELSVVVDARRLPQKRFADQAAYHRALQSVEWIPQPLTIHPA